MPEIYTILKCTGCYKTTILLSDETHKTLNRGRFFFSDECLEFDELQVGSIYRYEILQEYQ